MSECMTMTPEPFNLAKEREFYRYLPLGHSAFPFAPFDDASQKTFVPTPSRDNALTSFAQLGAIRLGAERALISLFGPAYQYILTEATRSPGPDGRDELRLGCCILPKENGICTDVENLPRSDSSDDPAIVRGCALVIPSMTEREDARKHGLVTGLLKAQFCAGVPIVSPRGNTIGSYCIFDTQPRRSGLDEPSVNFMKHMAETVMDYLETLQMRHENNQAKKMIFGLGSFVEGKGTLRDSWLEAREQDAETGRTGERVEGQLNIGLQDMQESQSRSQTRQLPHRPSKKNIERSGQEKTNASHPRKATFRSSVSGDKMQDDTVPVAFQRIFSRAANLIRESLEVEGVAFLDARIESFGGLVGYEARGERTSSEESTDSRSSGSSPPSSPTRRTADSDDATICRTISFSTTQSSSVNSDSASDSLPGHQYAVRETVLKMILNRYPHGKIFNYNRDGALSDDSSTSGVTASSGSTRTSRSKPGKRRRKQTHRQDADDLHRVLGGARSVIFLPLWDSHKSRWLAGVLVWTNTPERVFTAENELAFLRAFGNSVMAEVHRLDVEMAERAKTNLVTSISHELRSPLHGILGTADILSDTAMNALQQGMVHTIESCGRTLLDTINHLLDFTYIDKFKKDPKSKHRHGHHAKHRRKSSQERPNLERKPLSSGENTYEDVQLDSVLEEVVESVFAGHSFYNHPPARPRQSNSTGTAKVAVLPQKEVTIIFDIQEAEEWKFFTQAGCWRRILMNVFSNALKYTHQGYIYLGLKATESSGRGSNDSSESPDRNSEYKVTLTVKDTGQGIGAEFLQNSLFTPFSQEDTLAPGSGLGLSIVRKALASLHGSIEVTSEKDQGTEISIEVPLKLASVPDTSDGSSSSAAYSLIRKQAHGKTIGLIGFGSSLASERDATLYNALKRLCEDWFHLTVKTASLHHDSDPCDFYLMVHTELDGAEAEGNQPLDFNEMTKTSPLIVICPSPEAAHNMFARAMTTRRGRESIVEFISQPCGPRKLAKTLELCIQRLEGDAPRKDEETRWVELPESAHLPLDVGPSDAPHDRMKISKRPAETLGGPGSEEFNTATSDGEIREDTPVRDGVSSSQTPAGGNSDNTRPSILVADDNAVNLTILVAYIKKEGWDCATARNGLEAVEKFKAHPGKFIMVIIDISMPVMNGFEASQKIRQFEREYFDAHPDSKPSWYPTTITALTGLDSADAQQEAFASGIDTFLTKPIKRQNIRSLLERCSV